MSSLLMQDLVLEGVDLQLEFPQLFDFRFDMRREYPL